MRDPYRRFDTVPDHGEPRDLPNHPLVIAGRSIFPTRVFGPDGKRRVLKRGSTSVKYGDQISVGKWRGFPVYALNLEERATCPRSCQQWSRCYGNQSRAMERFQHGPELEAQLDIELSTLQLRYKYGFVVRLHGMGDFYSTSYVEQWSHWLDKFPALHIWGYTHWPRGSEIGHALISLRDSRWDRFALRLSDADEPIRCANVIESEAEAGDAIVCPMHTEAGRRNKVCCASCGLCWSKNRNIAFLAH